MVSKAWLEKVVNDPQKPDHQHEPPARINQHALCGPDYDEAHVILCGLSEVPGATRTVAVISPAQPRIEPTSSAFAPAHRIHPVLPGLNAPTHPPCASTHP